MSHKKMFKFGSRGVEIICKEDLTVEKLIDRDIIKSYMIKSKDHKYALVQCTKKYFIVAYLGQECGYIENKRTKTRDLFEFECPEEDISFFKLKKYKSSNHTYDYENEDSDNERTMIFKEGVFYLNSKGYTHHEKERA